jgi:DNA-binding beta-propeller fold protein YncE
MGKANNQFSFPHAIALDSSSAIFYVADMINSRVMKYSLNATWGVVVAGGNEQGPINTLLNKSYGICFDSSSNSLVIANTGANNIVCWVLGDTSWTLIAGDIGELFGSTPTLLRTPHDVILDSWGNVYVADVGNNRIQFFLAGQSTGITIAGITGISGTNSTLLDYPWSVALDTQLNLYVADFRTDRIQKFVHY